MKKAILCLLLVGSPALAGDNQDVINRSLTQQIRKLHERTMRLEKKGFQPATPQYQPQAQPRYEPPAQPQQPAERYTEVSDPEPRNYGPNVRVIARPRANGWNVQVEEDRPLLIRKRR